MGYSIDIETDNGTVTVDANFSWRMYSEKILNRRSLVEYVDIHIDIEGDAVSPTPGGNPVEVADRIKLLQDLVALRLKPVNLKIKLDGVERWTYTPATSSAGPAVINHDIPPEDGNGGSRWRFKLGLFVRLNGNNFEGLQELKTSLTVFTNLNGEITRKVWEATAQASSMDKALAGVMKFKPAGAVTQQLRKDFDELVVSAAWVWELSALTHDEQIRMRNGGGSWVEDKQAGVNREPILHKARRGAYDVELDGTVRGLEKDGVKAPPAHWQESTSMHRQFAHETQSFPTFASAQDRELGILTLQYEERWIYTGDKVPAPNHGTHGPAKQSEPPPADGAINR